MTESNNSRKGRPITNGKFTSRAELKQKAQSLQQERGLSVSSIARICKVSPPTIRSLLDM